MTAAAGRAALDAADATLKQARRTFDTASSAYDHARRQTPDKLAAAHPAWALAGHDWLRALIDHAKARDALIEARRPGLHPEEPA
ncbi:hypothetical protein Aple_081390 [Acrocarpospora pleiomorpha]|uniref:Uncharacterized protein n=1 Tax=Acrocarpospora pleiomorpha TaxID=90975 RepID=A0A5M3XWB8_9ACTN|nr:hypothetical protein [Acrocarpospora pleiomorpha]GES25240.1 hypothetical protein Aple_081390 [Acrocarpospora pleiomorpha]